MTPLSKYFSLEELCGSDLASRNGIDNIPTSPDVIAALTDLAREVLDPIREHFAVPLRPNSGFRCRKLEEKIYYKKVDQLRRKGGVAAVEDWFNAKQHPKGQAADIEIAGLHNRELFAWVRDNIPVYDQLILEGATNPEDPTSGWVHVSYARGTNRKKAFLMDDTGL